MEYIQGALGRVKYEIIDAYEPCYFNSYSYRDYYGYIRCRLVFSLDLVPNIIHLALPRLHDRYTQGGAIVFRLLE